LYVTSGRLYLATDYVKAQRFASPAPKSSVLADADVLVPHRSTLIARSVAGSFWAEMMWFSMAP
jgi:hypothetical protein